MPQDTSNVASHYNNIKSIGLDMRKNSKILGIRQVNNFIKSCLIHIYTEKNSVVLDMGCGKGGDLKKYEVKGIREYFGCDIAEESLKEALQRSVAMSFKVFCVKADFTSQKIQMAQKANLVSIQFCLHYAFKSEHALDTTILNIINNIAANGVVIITVPDSAVILRRSNRSLTGEFGNSLYKVRPKSKLDLLQSVYNQSYDFYLEEALTGCEEYLVSTEVFTEKMRSHGLTLILEQGFLEYLNSAIRTNKDIYDRLVTRKPTLEEIQAIELYKVLVYKKE
ncbi:mRNA (guanine-N7-)-methyltransferase [Nematocida sp. AWRm80]|nr:mRNA (guanine-N7-)-methyltransferase [Nematocida sp. AWRm80]